MAVLCSILKAATPIPNPAQGIQWFLPKMNSDDDMEAYLATFERTPRARGMGPQRLGLASNSTAYLRSAEHLLCTVCSVEDVTDYATLGALILDTATRSPKAVPLCKVTV